MRPCANASFTLLELLVAAALTAMLSALVLTVVTSALGHWDRAAGRLGASAQAHLALDLLEQDLQGAVFRTDGSVCLAATVLPDTTLSGVWKLAAAAGHAKPGNGHSCTLRLGAPAIEDARFGVAGVWLRFLTVKPDTGASATDLPAPVAVGYQLIRQNVTSSAASEQRYLLFRAEVRRTKTSGGAAGTFEAGYNLDPSASRATPYQAPSGTTGDPGNLLRPPLGSVLADNVIDFGVRLYVHEQGRRRLVFPAALDGTPSGALPPSGETEHLVRAGADDGGDSHGHAFPEVVEVMIRVLDGEGARLIAAFEAGRLNPPVGMDDGDYWWTLAEAHSEVFTQQIVIAARPFP